MMDCTACTERLHAFLDGELEDRETEGIQAHLDSCAECFARSEVEEAFRRSIRETATASPAPEALERRIRQALSEEYEREDGLTAVSETSQEVVPQATALPGRALQPLGDARLRVRRWLSRSMAAAAILLAAFTAHDVLLADGEASLGAVHHRVSVTGELVCVDCLIAARPLPRSGLDIHLDRSEDHVGGPESHHDLHLRMADGTVWELFPDTAALLDIGGHANVGRTATLLGTSYPDLRVIQVARAVLN